MTNPVDIPELYEHVILKGVVSPGICEVTGGDRVYEWDKKKGKGTSGGTSTFQGDEVAEFSVRFQLWKEFGEGKTDHFAEWQDTFRPVLVGMMIDGKPEAADIYHPMLEENGIRAVSIAKIGQMTREGQGLYSVTVDFLEYRKPKKSGGTPGGAGGQHGSPAEQAGSSLGGAAGAAAASNTWDRSYDETGFDE